MAKRKYFYHKGQAALELAIFGSLILMAFSVVLMYGQRLEMQQQVKMESFRKALQKAYERNSSVTYTLKKDNRFFNLFSGFGQGQASAISATSSAMWQKGMPGRQGSDRQESYSYYVINDNIIGDADDGLPRYPKKVRDYTGADKTVWAPLSIWKEEQAREEKVKGEVTKEECPVEGISNKRKTTLKDTINIMMSGRVDTAYDDNPWDKESPLPEYRYEAQTYTYEGRPYTVQSIAPISQGAYFNQDTNRIEYSSGRVDTEIQRERDWQTNY